MAIGLLFVLTVLLISSFPPSIPASYYSLPEIKPWCSQVPSPDLCEHFLIHRPKHDNIPSIRRNSDFLKVSVQLVLERAINASKMAARLGSKCRSESETAAWRDCLDLYKNTINILNQTNDPAAVTKFIPYDIQTWLATTLTNLGTCKQGFIDFGITDNVMPSVIDMVLQNLTINALALNSEACNNNKPGYRKGFPAWLSPLERRLLQTPTSSPNFDSDFVVAKDGSGQFTKVADAVNEAAKYGGLKRLVIYVRAGIYEEIINIETNKIMLIGDGIRITTISGDLRPGGNLTSDRAATVIVQGGRFMARDITFRNTAGPHAGRAVALRSDSDYSVYYNCSMEGYQDTLYVRTNTQFFRQCFIFGTVDFIMGDATVVFQKCRILARDHHPNRINVITAQSRSNPLTCTGMVFDRCIVEGAPDLKPIQDTVETYLGRPWMRYSRVVFMNSFLDKLIHPKGWMEWDTPLDLIYYGEYNNSGPGAFVGGRVTWPGFHVITDRNEASKFSVRSFIHGDSWLPQTFVPFDPDI